MSSYIKATDFASKDALLTGDPLKIVSGTELDDEFNGVQTAINTKANLNSPTLTGTPLAPTATAGLANTQIANTSFVSTAITAVDATLTAAIEALNPVGTIYINASNGTNPATLLGFGTWVAFGAGRVPVGFNSGNTLFDTAEETGGSADATLVSHTHTFSGTTNTDGSHNHVVNVDHKDAGVSNTGGQRVGDTGNAPFGKNITSSTAGSHNHSFSGTTNTNGSSATNANYQPYITVYMWKRTA